MENSGKKYQIDTEENKMFLGELQKNLLNFGKGFLSPGGSAYFLGDDGTPWKDRNRETWITCRMVHVYSMGIMLGDKESPALVHGAVHGLLEELKDCENGGWYPGITPDNKFLPDKQCYAHAFVLLAASSALLAEKKMQKLCLKMHWNYLINGSGMKNRDLLMIPGIQNLQFLMIIAVLTQICIQ